MIRHLKKSEIVWVNLGDLDQVAGHEQAYTRPCIVIKEFDSMELAIVIPMTTRAKPYYSVVKIDKAETGMDKDSFALCHQLRTVSYDRIVGRGNLLSERAFNKVRSVLNDILALG